MLFKRFLTIWFLLFTLISNTAWAVTDHGDDDHDGDLMTEIAGDHLLPSWADDACDDHCDHASVHVVGLIGLVATFGQAAKSPVAVSPLSKPLSREPSPLYHPPII